MNPVGFDNTMLSLLLNPRCKLPRDEKHALIPNALRRAEYLVERLGKARQKIILPTPATAELMTAVGHDAQKYYDVVARSRLFEIAAFDQRCAVELAILNRTTFNLADRKNSAEPYQKIKVDRQIIAILKVNGVDTLYTDDAPLANRAQLCGITAVATRDLPEPEQDRQLKIEFEARDELPGVSFEETEPNRAASVRTGAADGESQGVTNAT